VTEDEIHALLQEGSKAGVIDQSDWSLRSLSRMEIVDMDGRRIDKVLAARLPDIQDQEASRDGPPGE
jgi:hypothetical protein